MYKPLLLFIAMVISICIAHSQIETTKGDHYQVSYAQFSPPTKDVIKALVGTKATPFLAKDQYQQDLYLGDLIGQEVLLWFWDPASPICVAQLHEMNQVANYFADEKVQIVGFAKGNRSELDAFIESSQIDFRVIPNAGLLGEGPYVGEFGFPRMFFINKHGLIQKILPSEAFNKGVNSLELAKEILRDQLSVE